MIIETPGKVSDHITMFGRKESCVYMVSCDEERILIGGGTAYIIPEMLEQTASLGIDENTISHLVILHAHFDHCGIVPFFKKRWPKVRIAGSERAGTLLTTPKVVDAIGGLNQFMITQYGRQEQARELGIEFTAVDVDPTLKDGDTLTCGRLHLNIIETPGHSSCSISVYIPEEKALFASDAGGIPFGDDVFTAANSNFDQYMASLEKMSAYDVDIYLAEHFGARTGADGRSFLQKSRASAVKARQLLEASYARTRDIDKSTQEMTEFFMKNSPEGFFPAEVTSLVVRQMLSYLAKKAAVH